MCLGAINYQQRRNGIRCRPCQFFALVMVTALMFGKSVVALCLLLPFPRRSSNALIALIGFHHVRQAAIHSAVVVQVHGPLVGHEGPLGPDTDEPTGGFAGSTVSLKAFPCPPGLDIDVCAPSKSRPWTLERTLSRHHAPYIYPTKRHDWPRENSGACAPHRGIPYNDATVRVWHCGQESRCNDSAQQAATTHSPAVDGAVRCQGQSPR